MDQLLAGKARIADVDDAVTEWHKMPEDPGVSLAEWLGLSSEEYGRFLHGNAVLKDILRERRKRPVFSERTLIRVQKYARQFGESPNQVVEAGLKLLKQRTDPWKCVVGGRSASVKMRSAARMRVSAKKTATRKKK